VEASQLMFIGIVLAILGAARRVGNECGRERRSCGSHHDMAADAGTARRFRANHCRSCHNTVEEVRIILEGLSLSCLGDPIQILT
jgi:hypothetical protein